MVRARGIHGAPGFSRGLTLVETLVALLVLSIGLLGLAGLQTSSLRFNNSALHRTQATALAYDVVDRMRANRRAALNSDYDGGFDSRACGGAVGGTPVERDVAEWRDRVACKLPDGTASIVRNGNEFTVTMQWHEAQTPNTPMQFVFVTAL